jgi:hypothetical protein
MSGLPNKLNNIVEFIRQGKHQLEIWQILLTISLTAGSTAFLLYQILSTDFLSLHNFNDRTIGIAVLTATDTSHRTILYIGLYTAAFLLFCAVLFILIFLNEQYLEKVAIDFEKELLFYASLFSIASLLLYGLSQQLVFLTVYKIFIVLLFLVGVIILSKYFGIIRKKPVLCEIFSDPSMVILSFVIPYCCIFIYWIFFDRAFSFSSIHFVLYTIIWFFQVIAYYSIVVSLKKKNIDRTILNESLIKSIIPIISIPFIIPLSNELQYTISANYSITPAGIVKIFVIALMCISAGIFYLTLKRNKGSIDTFTYIKNYYFPIIILSWGLFKYYQHFLKMSSYDIFHHGELMISPQQLFSFHNLPFIGILPTHGFSEMSYQILYSLVNGYTPVQPLIWNWIPVLIGMIIFYFVLSKITTPLFAFFSIVFIPIFGIVNSSGFFYYSFCLLPIFTFIWLIKKPVFFRFCIHWLMILALFVWRIDFGVAACIGTILIFSVILFKESIHSKYTPFKILKKILFSFVLINVPALVCYCLALTYFNKPIIETILVNIQFFDYQAPIMAYPTLFNSFSVMVIFEYIILPLIALIFVISFVFDQIVGNNRCKETQMVLAFLAVVTLVLSIRSLQRHSLVEGYVSMFFPLLLILLPLNFEIKRKQIQYVAIIILFLMYVTAFPAFTVMVPNENTKIFEYHTWTGKESRIIDDKGSFQNLTHFFNTTLTQNETFFDFSNAPLLYVFTNKEFIPYVIPNLYQSSEIIQNDIIQRFDKQYQQNRVPVVIFKQSSWWDYVDNVPNEIRSYRIAEYIYQHYSPVGYIDGKYQIWVADNLDAARLLKFEQQPGFTPITTISQNYNLQKLPYIWGTYDPMDTKEKTSIIENVTNGSTVLMKNKVYSYSIHSAFDKTSGNYLYLCIKGSRSSNVTLRYGSNNTNSIAFSTIPSAKFENYLVRISTQWEWMNSDIEKISIASDGDLELSEMNIRKGD